MTAAPNLLTQTPPKSGIGAMDALSDVLRVVGLTGGVILDAEFSEPWFVSGKMSPERSAPFMLPPEHVVCFPFVVEGEFDL